MRQKEVTGYLGGNDNGQSNLKDQIRAHRRRLHEIREARQSVQAVAARQQLQKEEKLMNYQLDILLEELRLLSDD